MPDKEESRDLPSSSVESSASKSTVEKANTGNGKESATLSLSTVYKQDKAPWNWSNSNLMKLPKKLLKELFYKKLQMMWQAA